LDVLPSPFALPEDVREGDWIEIDRVGAYSNALATRFNGFHPETMVTVHDRAIMPSL
jgi:ornithine decarboxylase